jgi:hypothetical protein
VRGSTLRLLIPVLGVLALLGVVAVAATGSTPSGSSNARRPGDAFLDTLFSLWLIALIPAAALFVYGLMQRRAIAEEIASGRYRRRGLGFFLAFFAVLTAAAYLGILHRHWHPLGTAAEGSPLINTSARGGSVQTRDVHMYHAEFAWLQVLVILGLAGLAGLAWFVAARRRKEDAAGRGTVAETLTDVIEETLDDLRAESDPRRAVIACYARLERALAAFGFPRRVAETQEEHLTRILGDLDVETGSISRLTELFTRAKFSQHEVGAEMKEEAIAALVQVRDELRAVDERRRIELEQALAVGAVRS